ncbi:MAG TPA: TIM barrel protein [Bryobacteraceae bacterium]|jgi:sugar phosphate isomerase/epimerase|nr:TIM barrel protein [Bryobacteraceae bacterium]
MNRREALKSIGALGTSLGSAALLGGGAALLGAQDAVERLGGPKTGAAKMARSTPLVCAYSKNLAKVPYAELGTIAGQIGYDGIDLTVMDGGHVNPHITNVDLVRAIESVRGANLEVPMISTTLTTVNNDTAFPILAITGHTDVHLYRMGFWPWGTVNPQQRLAEVRNDLMSLMLAGQRYEMIALLPNHAGGFVGGSVWDAQMLIGNMDPAWIGYYFDPSQTQEWEPALRMALPRVKAVAVQDFYWEKSGGVWARKMCPMGEGSIDWGLFFRILSQARYTGPLSIHFEYAAQDELGALTKDLEFVRKQVQSNWAAS